LREVPITTGRPSSAIHRPASGRRTHMTSASSAYLANSERGSAVSPSAPPFDLILGRSVLHHLEFKEFLERVAASNLVTGGRMLDGTVGASSCVGVSQARAVGAYAGGVSTSAA